MSKNQAQKLATNEIEEGRFLQGVRKRLNLKDVMLQFLVQTFEFS